MKPLLLLLCFAALFSCNNDKTTKTESTPVTTAPDNVDGNLPDSTNSMNANPSLRVDSSRLKDSMRP